MNTEIDPWDVFSELCRRVVEDKNVVLKVFVGSTGVEMALVPIDEDKYED